MITTAAPDFAAHFPSGGRLAGLDVGTKTIGVATCDVNWSFATPDKTILRKKFAADLETLKAVLAQHSIVGLVVGLPLNLNGSDSPRTQSTRAFARNLLPLAMPILLWDERWSTAAVERAMIAADISRAKRAERVDSAAAAFILQGAIDAMTR
ncbi:MAG: Holliday junction resolvase RuvX [Sphingopyxis sp.]|nr:Holliday junction resolvase RuvX [Sphingopyxis sp.]